MSTLALLLLGPPALLLGLVLLDEAWVLWAAVRAPARPPVPSDLSTKPRCALLVAAHDEAAALPGLLASVRALAYPPERLAVFVVADRCTDATASVARAAGAQVLERTAADARPGKGPALNDLLRWMAPGREAFDVFIVLDADLRLDPGWLRAMLATHQAGYPVVQGASFTRRPDESALAGVAQAAQQAQHLVQCARMHLGLQNLIIGNTLLIGREVLQALDWRCAWHSPTEEEIKLPLIERSVRIGYAAEARVEEEAVPGVAELARQRSRWFRDHLFYLKRAPRVIARALWRRQWRQAEAGLAHLVMSSHTLELMAFAAFAGAAALSGQASWRFVGFVLLAGKLVHGVVLARSAGLAWRDMGVLAWRLPALALGWMWGMARHLAGVDDAWSHTRHRG